MNERLPPRDETWRALFEHSPDAIFIEDLQGNVLNVNQSACRLHRMDREHLVGRNVLDLVPPSERAAVAAAYPAWAARALDSYEGFSYASDGQATPVEIRCNQIEYDGQSALLLHVRDVSARRQAEQELRQAEADRRHMEARLRQSEKMEAIGALAGGIAHDFNNLLTAIHGNAELIGLNAPEGSETAELARQIAKAGDRMANLTTQLLAFSRKLRLYAVPVDVNQCILDVRGLLLRSIDPRIEIVLELAAQHAVIMGDPAQIESALLNLAVNARDAMPDGGRLTFQTGNIAPAPSLQALPGMAVEATDWLRVQVSDTGTGMSEEVRRRAFEPFFTTKQPGQGTGLGLACVYGCVTAHRGVVDLVSRPGLGTRVILDLPLPLTLPEVVETEAPGALVRGCGSILIVDDEDVVLSFLSAALRRLGYKCVACRDGEEALRHFEHHSRSTDLVILDLTMPKMNGLQVFRALQRLDPAVKVLLSSGFDGTESVGEAGAAGVLGFLNKPYTMAELSQVLAQHVNGGRHEGFCKSLSR